MPGPRGPKGPKPKIKNPGKLFSRLMKFVFEEYKFQCLIVAICIIISVLANGVGTLFIQSLVDDYIVPLKNAQSTDFTP